jgi:hypothetical protein
VVETLVQTPRLNGDGEKTGRFLRVLKLLPKATVFTFLEVFFRGLFIS